MHAIQVSIKKRKCDIYKVFIVNSNYLLMLILGNMVMLLLNFVLGMEMSLIRN